MTLALCQMQQVQVIRERIRVFEQKNRMRAELNRACAKAGNYPAANDDFRFTMIDLSAFFQH